MADQTTVQQLGWCLRDVLNDPVVRDRLMQDARRWRQLCSSMDVIDDTDSAIAAYLGSPPIEDIGQLYLLAYGLLQVLFVQQHAVRHGSEAVGLQYQFPEQLMAVRKTRNNAIGHSTKRGNRESESFGVVKVSLSHEDSRSIRSIGRSQMPFGRYDSGNSSMY